MNKLSERAAKNKREYNRQYQIEHPEKSYISNKKYLFKKKLQFLETLLGKEGGG